jgi:hypothetical protein
MSFHGVTPMWWMWNRIWFIGISCEMHWLPGAARGIPFA